MGCGGEAQGMQVRVDVQSTRKDQCYARDVIERLDSRLGLFVSRHAFDALHERIGGQTGVPLSSVSSTSLAAAERQTTSSPNGSLCPPSSSIHPSSTLLILLPPRTSTPFRLNLLSA